MNQCINDLQMVLARMKRSVTQLVKDYLHHQGIKQTHLAKLLNERPQNLNKRLKQKDIDTDYLLRISEALEHDFFFEISQQIRILTAKEFLQSSLAIGMPASIPAAGDSQYKEKYLAMLEENRTLRIKLERQGAESGKK